jgi:hypothetical protein
MITSNDGLRSLLKLPIGILVFWLALGSMVSLLLMYLMTQWTVTAVFQVTAESEYLSGDLDILNNQESTHLRWSLHGASLRARDEAGGRLHVEVQQALLSIGGPAGFEVERVSHGSLRMAITALGNREQQFFVNLEQEGQDRIRLYPPVFVVVTATERPAAGGHTVSLPFQAMNVVLGREPRTRALRTQPILRSGDVTVLGRTAVQNRIYVAKSSKLRGGDVVTATDNDEPSKVLVRVDERPALQVVMRMEAEKLAISGFYTDPRFEQISLFNMLSNDYILAGLGSLLTLLVALLGAIFSVRATPNEEPVSEPTLLTASTDTKTLNADVPDSTPPPNANTNEA